MMLAHLRFGQFMVCFLPPRRVVAAKAPSAEIVRSTGSSAALEGVESTHQMMLKALHRGSAEPRFDMPEIELQAVAKRRCGGTQGAHQGHRSKEVQLFDFELPVPLLNIEAL